MQVKQYFLVITEQWGACCEDTSAHKEVWCWGVQPNLGIMETVAVPSIEKAGTGFSVALGDSVVTSF